MISIAFAYYLCVIFLALGFIAGVIVGRRT